jgi:hypothetical protein
MAAADCLCALDGPGVGSQLFQAIIGISGKTKCYFPICTVFAALSVACAASAVSGKEPEYAGANGRDVMPLESPRSPSNASQIVAAQAEVDQLRAELKQLRDKQALLLEQQKTIMELIGCVKSEKIVHDIRNVLNERNLLRTLTEDRFAK